MRRMWRKTDRKAELGSDLASLHTPCLGFYLKNV